MIEHTGPISGLATYGGLFVATAGYDNRVILWDATTRRALAQGWHDHLANQCAFSPDGKRLVSSGSDYTARIWSVPEMRLLSVIGAHTDDVFQSSYSPDGLYLATASYDRTIAVHDAVGNCIHQLKGHESFIESFDWSRDSTKIRSCGADGTVRTWDISTGACASVELGNGQDMDAVVNLPSGGYVFGSNDGTVTVTNSQGRKADHLAHSSGVKRLVIDDEATVLLSVGYDRHVILWQIGEGDCLNLQKKIVFPDSVWARSAAFLKSGNVAFATFGSTYAEWDIKNNNWILENYTPSRSINAVCVSDNAIYCVGDAGYVYKNGVRNAGPETLINFITIIDGDVVTGGHNGEIYSERLGTAIYKHNAPNNCCAQFRRLGETILAVGSYSGDIIFLRVLAERYEFIRILKVHSNAIKGIATDGKVICTGCADGELGVVDIVSLELHKKTKSAHSSILNGLCAYRDGFASVSRDLTLQLWAGQASSSYKSRHTNSIKCIAANKSGELIATGSYGGTIDVFDINLNEWRGVIKRPTTAGISSLVWHDCQQQFLAGAYDGVVYAIPTDDGQWIDCRTRLNQIKT
jgi:WD40 repeat protein